MRTVRAFILLAALALPLGLSLGTAALAQNWDLTGEWTFHFTVEDGPTYSDPCYVEQKGDTIKGMVVYEEGGNQYKEPFEGTVTPEGTVTFVLYDAGKPVEHWGRVLDNGDTVSGQWSFSDGQGAFTMTRN